MIQLTVTTFNDTPVSHLAGSFDELGGTIGRAPTNQLVLPDPERVVSRVHAKVVCRGGSYALVACGGNALIHNGKMVEHGAEVMLTPGDSIEMGGYRLVVGAPESLANAPFKKGPLAQPAARPNTRGMKAPSKRTPHASPSQSAHDLLPALLEGLGVPDLPVDQLTPALMNQVGQILRESTKGALDLLSIRTALKREIRAGVTIINARQNNSLKFSPSVDVALRHMLGPQARGFMPPVDSVRHAFEDLRAHELAVMVGMKAALAGVLERFDPAVLERKLASRSPLADLIPSARKAKLWDLFETLYKQLAAEAVDDFDSLFGKAFLKAYEQYLEQMSDESARD